jgi:hypothetical protein
MNQDLSTVFIIKSTRQTNLIMTGVTAEFKMCLSFVLEIHLYWKMMSDPIRPVARNPKYLFFSLLTCCVPVFIKHGEFKEYILKAHDGPSHLVKGFWQHA